MRCARHVSAAAQSHVRTPLRPGRQRLRRGGCGLVERPWRGAAGGLPCLLTHPRAASSGVAGGRGAGGDVGQWLVVT